MSLCQSPMQMANIYRTLVKKVARKEDNFEKDNQEPINCVPFSTFHKANFLKVGQESLLHV